MPEFPIRRVDPVRREGFEPLGTKRKFWFREDDRWLLFKAEDRGTGDDWAEVISSHLCAILGLPHVDYELATEGDGMGEPRPGSVCANMAPAPLSLVLGNELLLARDANYPHEQRFKVRQHTVEAVADIVSTLHQPAAEWMTGAPAGVESALDVFAGYVMLDAWIANIDRHHENWAAIRYPDEDKMRLAPTFDHGAALARNLLDTEREERLTTKDRNRTVTAFAAKGRSAFFGSADDAKPLELREAFRAFAAVAPRAVATWLERLRSLDRDAVWGIVESVPRIRMSETCRRFTAELLMVNQARLLEPM